jgi:nitrite reductase/ring-hydroxylating ferredoxin subunit
MSFHWVKIFDNEEAMLNNIAKGSVQSFVIRGNKICLAHSKDGVFAVSERCPHNGASLAHGMCNENNQIVCPMHRYPFDLRTGKAAAGLAYSLITYPLKTESDGVYIGIKAKWWEM